MTLLEKHDEHLMEQYKTQLLFFTTMPTGMYDICTLLPFLKRLSWQTHGWLSIERNNDETILFWTTGKDTHFMLDTAYSINIKSDGMISIYMESAISMWIKWGYGRGTQIELKRALKRVDRLYNIFSKHNWNTSNG